MKKGILTGIILMMLLAGAEAAIQDLQGLAKTDFRSAKMYFNQQIFEKAIPFYEKVLEANPYHIESLMSLAGVEYEVNKDYWKAHALYERVLEAIDMVYAEYDELQATDSKAAGKYYKTYIKKAGLEKEKNSATTLLNNCWTYIFQEGLGKFKAEDYTGSLETYIPLLEIAPDSLITIKMIANNYFKLDDKVNGIKYFEMAYQMEPDNEETARMIGYNYLQLGEQEKAVVWYQKATENNPDNEDNFYNIGVIYNDLKRYQDAMAMFERVLVINPQNVDALYNARVIANQLKDIDSFVKYSQMEFDLNGEDAANLRLFCFQLVNLDANEQILKYGKKWAELAPDDPSPYQLMFVAAKKLGNKELQTEYQKKLSGMQ
ncbi:MAG: tetratricopeptide repeat protein [Candidatus Cloacimonetes bacterium]|nr:tetratricopeptide repeat protein [Candidatus Cloacimonadota bacterium]